MRLERKSRKITEVTVQKLRGGKLLFESWRQHPLGLKPAWILEVYAALKRRSSTVLHAFVHDATSIRGFFPQPLKNVPFPNTFRRGLLGRH
jgi:hypothetical protein